jgi:serine protease inhibitor
MRRLNRILQGGIVIGALLAAQCSTAFDAGQTESAMALSDGSELPTQMMRQTGSYAYYRGADFQAVRLPYGQGRLCMLVVLPDVGVSLGSFVAGITPAKLKQWTAQLQKSRGSITLPLNYPFFYAIEDGKTGEPLFVGILVSPS